MALVRALTFLLFFYLIDLAKSPASIIGDILQDEEESLLLSDIPLSPILIHEGEGGRNSDEKTTSLFDLSVDKLIEDVSGDIVRSQLIR